MSRKKPDGAMKIAMQSILRDLEFSTPSTNSNNINPQDGEKDTSKSDSSKKATGREELIKNIVEKNKIERKSRAAEQNTLDYEQQKGGLRNKIPVKFSKVGQKSIRKSQAEGVHQIEGTIVSFNKEKGYGFVLPPEGKAIFVHQSGFVDNDHLKLGGHGGEKVMMDITKGQKGPEAVNVKVLDTNHLTVTKTVYNPDTYGPRTPKKTILKEKISTKNPKLEYDLWDIKSYPNIEIAKNTRINPVLLESVSRGILSQDYTNKHQDQIYNGEKGETDLCVGLDFGTSYTKVIIMEQGTRQAYAVPFMTGAENPYLLPSYVYLHEGIFNITGRIGKLISDLKLPLIEGKYKKQHILYATAFLALVIRQTRQWFLQFNAKDFEGFEFNWFYQMGIPASNMRDEKLVSNFSDILTSAVKLSLSPSATITEEDLLKSIHPTNSNSLPGGLKSRAEHGSVTTIPEISAQLHGFAQSNRWDRNRPKFMLVDIGGGTVDAAIVNITNPNRRSFQYNVLKTIVVPLGAKVLHRTRLEWISHSAQFASVKNEIVNYFEGSNGINLIESRILDKVIDYLMYANFPQDFDLDKIFYKKYYKHLGEDLVRPVRSFIDVAPEQWKSLQFIICGGGSLLDIYRNYACDVNKNQSSNLNLDVVQTDLPDNLIAEELPTREYHRLSVAFGLSHLDIGTYVDPANLVPYEAPTSHSSEDSFISKDMM